MLYHRMSSAQGLMSAIASTGDWVLVYYDETAVIFVRAAGNAELIGAARDAFTKTWLARNDAALTAPRRTYRWQWSIERYTAQIAYARALEVIGDIKGAWTWFDVAIAGGLPPAIEVGARRDAAECLVYLGNLPQARVHLVRALEIDPTNEDTRNKLRRLDASSGGKP
jgi:tetratricopeptide (TPR) repeat protein